MIKYKLRPVINELDFKMAFMSSGLLWAIKERAKAIDAHYFIPSPKELRGPIQEVGLRNNCSRVQHEGSEEYLEAELLDFRNGVGKFFVILEKIDE